jgi:hypothetical protein
MKIMKESQDVKKISEKYAKKGVEIITLDDQTVVESEAALPEKTVAKDSKVAKSFGGKK